MYTAKVIDQIEQGKVYINHLRVGVFKGEEQVGEYERHYSCLFHTFFPFRVGQQWYALYSADYTATQVMELPSCKQVASEEISSFGFCPTGFFVAKYTEDLYKGYTPEELVEKKIPEQNWPWGGKDRIERDYNWKFDDYAEHEPDARRHLVCGGTFTYDLNMAFVSGCVWGDDSSWKVERLDLSKIAEGKVSRHNDLGYIELAYGQNLQEAVHVSHEHRFSIAVQKSFILDKEGKAVSADDE